MPEKGVDDVSLSLRPPATMQGEIIILHSLSSDLLSRYTEKKTSPPQVSKLPKSWLPRKYRCEKMFTR